MTRSTEVDIDSATLVYDEEGSGNALYHGYRDSSAPLSDACRVVVNGEPLDPKLNLLSASPDGFEWGYGGSGPAQLALAILADAYGDEVALDLYHEFKSEVVTKLPEEEWTLTQRDLDQWMAGVDP